MIANINAASSSGSIAALGRLDGPKGPSTTDPLGGVADLLGTTSDELLERLRSGASLSDLAAEAGVARDDLLAAIEDGLPTAPEGASGVDTAALVAGIADQHGLPAPRRMERPSGPPPTREGGMTQLEGVADLFGMEVEDLVDRLDDGSTSLASLAEEHGVSSDQVFQALRQGMFADVRA